TPCRPSTCSSGPIVGWASRSSGILISPHFFLQAEDGIRDATVTGVQTCALPIYGFEPRVPPGQGRSRARSHGPWEAEGAHPRLRSEERRVGKDRRWEVSTEGLCTKYFNALSTVIYFIIAHVISTAWSPQVRRLTG